MGFISSIIKNGRKSISVFGWSPGTRPVNVPMQIPKNINNKISKNIINKSIKKFKSNKVFIKAKGGKMFFGKPDPKKIEKMMKKLNMDVKNIEAEEVIIKTKSKDIIITEPEVMITNMMGKDIYQITGNVKEKQTISEEDIKLVMEQTGKDRETVVKKLEEVENDIAKAIMELKE